MGAKRDYPKILIVEGQDDKFSVISLMKHHIEWPENMEGWPVYVEVSFSVEEILTQGYLTAQVKAGHLQTMGVMLDADDHSAGRYQRLKDLLKQLFPGLPEGIAGDGLITENDDKKRLGIWIMPDNASEGCMEVFLRDPVRTAPSGVALCRGFCEAGTGSRSALPGGARIESRAVYVARMARSPGILSRDGPHQEDFGPPLACRELR